MDRSVPTPIELGWSSDEQHRSVRALRVVLLLPIMAIVSAVSAVRSPDVVGTSLLVGLGSVVLATTLTFTKSFVRFAPWVMVAIPVLDLAGICSFNLVAGTDAVGALVAVPAMWLGGIFVWRGVACVAVASTFGFAVVGLWDRGVWFAGGSHAASLIILGVLSSVLMVFVVKLTTKQMMRLEEQGDQLAEALEGAETHRQHLEAIVGAVDVGLAFVEPGGHQVSMNDRHREFLALAFPDGHTGMAGQVGQMYTADNLTLLDPDQVPSARALRGESFSDFLIWIGADPTLRRALAVSAQPFRDQAGVVVGAVLAVHDVTDLMCALRVKEDFVALVSHELRTPLTSIMGFLEMSSEFNADLPVEVVHYLDVASRNADKLLSLVSDLLTTGRSQGGSAMQLFPQEVDMSALVLAALNDLTQRVEIADITLVTDLEPLVCVFADPNRITQVVDNLLSNAVKYTPPGGTITVTLIRDGSGVRLGVRDTGIGISQIDQQGLFTKFFRAASATEREIAGMGLGLAIAKAIVEAHGGQITLSSTEGLGTSVDVMLPHGRNAPKVLAGQLPSLVV